MCDVRWWPLRAAHTRGTHPPRHARANIAGWGLPHRAAAPPAARAPPAQRRDLKQVVQPHPPAAAAKRHSGIQRQRSRPQRGSAAARAKKPSARPSPPSPPPRHASFPPHHARRPIEQGPRRRGKGGSAKRRAHNRARADLTSIGGLAKVFLPITRPTLSRRVRVGCTPEVAQRGAGAGGERARACGGAQAGLSLGARAIQSAEVWEKKQVRLLSHSTQHALTRTTRTRHTPRA